MASGLRSTSQCAGLFDRCGLLGRVRSGEPQQMKHAYWARILFIAIAALPATAQVATNDLFNRPDSGSLGADWTEQDGDAKIQNGKLQANSPFGFGWCSHTAFQASYANVVVRAAWEMNG